MKNDGKYQALLVQIEHTLITLGGEKKFSNCAGWINTLVHNHIKQGNEEAFLLAFDELLKGYPTTT